MDECLSILVMDLGHYMDDVCVMWMYGLFYLMACVPGDAVFFMTVVKIIIAFIFIVNIVYSK